MTQPTDQAPVDAPRTEDAAAQPDPSQASTGTPQAQLDPFKVKRFTEQVRSDQNLSLALFAGFAAALVGAVVWAMITVATGFQIGWMAVGVGFLVGWSVRRFGQGIDKTFGIAGAVLALLGCMAGNLLSVCVLLSRQLEVGLGQVLINLDGASTLELLTATFHPMDVLFYGLAIYEGYRFSFRRITEAELQKLTT